MTDLLSKLEAIHYRFLEVGNLITDPAIISDMERYVKFLDILIPTLMYVKKQAFKPKHTHDLLSQLPSFQKKDFDTLFVQSDSAELVAEAKK